MNKYLLKIYALPVGSLIALAGGVNLAEAGYGFGYILGTAGLVGLAFCGAVLYFLKDFKM